MVSGQFGIGCTLESYTENYPNNGRGDILDRAVRNGSSSALITRIASSSCHGLERRRMTYEQGADSGAKGLGSCPIDSKRIVQSRNVTDEFGGKR